MRSVIIAAVMKSHSINHHSGRASKSTKGIKILGINSRTLLLATSLLLFSAATPLALSQKEEEKENRWETRVLFGFDNADSTAVTTSFPDESNTGDLEFGSGIAFGGTVGYNFANDLLLELDYTWRSADEGDAPDSLFGAGASADVASVIISPNLWYKPTLDKMPKFSPRFGIGFGWFQEVSMDVIINGVEQSYDGDGSGVLLMAGLDWDISDKWVFGIDAKYYDGGNINATSESDASRAVSFDYSGTTLNLSLGFNF